MRWALAGVAALSVGACASRPDAGSPAQRPPSVVASGEALVFVSFDSDRDYRTSRDELARGLDAEWSALGAQTLSPIVFQQWAQRALGDPDMGPFRLQFDSNVDGDITREEFDALLTGRFEDLDADDDGFVARNELVRRLASPSPFGGRAPERRPPGGAFPRDR
ncbi:MAG: hypothetical protein GC189_06085 [Alphaproteobacteria bacterium]|nr:hypothetical protein [Alphaproteobacteria bacterium]